MVAPIAAETHTIEIMDLRKLTVQQSNAIDLLVTGCSDREAAEAVGVNRSTITRWRLYHPAFQAELNAQRAALWGQAKEKLRSLIPEAVDILADALHDPNNDDRAKLALELLKTVKASEDLNSHGNTDPDKIIEGSAKRPMFASLDAPADWEIRAREIELQARLNGLTPSELATLIEDAEKARKKAIREARKASQQLPEASPDEPSPEELDTAHEDLEPVPGPALEPSIPAEELDAIANSASSCPGPQLITIEDEPPRKEPAEVPLISDEVNR